VKSKEIPEEKDEMLNILIAEDHKLLRRISRQVLTELYPLAVFFETDNIADLVEFSSMQQFDLMLLDIYLVDGNALSVLPTINALQPQTGILFFTMCAEEIYGTRVLNNGANGFLNKSADETELKEAVSTILSGKCYFSRKLQRRIADEVITKRTINPFDRLSVREFEIMHLLLQGKSLTDISSEISIQISTIGTYKTRLFEKLNVSSLMELGKMASAYNIL
jgi:two-component system, NarL family, invasion response regulator UvrY